MVQKKPPPWGSPRWRAGSSQSRRRNLYCYALRVFLEQPLWLQTIVLSIAGTVLVLLGYQAIGAFAEWIEVQMALRSGRHISFETAFERCKSLEGFILVQGARPPMKLWYVEGREESVLHPIFAIPKVGLIVRSVPRDASQLLKSIEDNGRVRDVDFSNLLS